MYNFRNIFTLENIDNISILDYGYFREDNQYTIQVLLNIGLLNNYRVCCGERMNLCVRNDTSDGFNFKCYKCNKRISLRDGSIFAMSKLPLWKGFLLIVSFIQHPSFTYDDIQKHFGISCRTTISEWKCIIRDLMMCKLSDDFSKIGGKGKIVQIDESAICKRKYNVGRILKNQQYWMVGGIDEDGNCFLKITKRRTRKILETIIMENVEDESIIWTDGWAGYNRLADLGFVHGTVIHKRKFVSNEGVHTNKIEATWGAFKRKYRNATNKNPNSLPGYVADFIYRKKYFGHELRTLCQYIITL